MPFTLSHPAAVAPLWPIARRFRLSLAALAIGAMVPDFEFFLHLRPAARWSHALVGVFTLHRAGALDRLRHSRWRQRTLVALALGALLGACSGWRLERPSNFWTLQVTIGRVAVGALLGLSLATLAFCVAFRSYGRRALPPAA
jgi:hypothetical protein